MIRFNTSNISLLIASLLVTCLISTSCNNQGCCDLTHPHGSVEVREIAVSLDWSKAEAASNAVGRPAPASVALYFYPVEGGPLTLRSGTEAEPLRYRYELTVRDSVSGRIEGGSIKLPVAEYNVICISSDIDESIAFDHTERFETFEVGPRAGTEAVSNTGVLGASLPRAAASLRSLL